MFDKFRQQPQSEVDAEIARVKLAMSTADMNSDEYAKLMTHMERLMKIKEKSRSRVSPDTKWIVIGGIIQVIVVVAYEHGHVIATKAISMVQRAKV